MGTQKIPSIYLSLFLVFLLRLAPTWAQSPWKKAEYIGNPRPMVQSLDLLLDVSMTSLVQKAGIKFPLQVYQSGKEIWVGLEGIPQIKAQSNQDFTLILPLVWKAEPSLAGISAGNLEGSLNLKAQLKWKYPNPLELIDYSYDWKQKPSVRMLGASVSVGALVDQALALRKKTMLSSIQEELKRWSAAKTLEVLAYPIIKKQMDDLGMGPLKKINIKHLELRDAGLKLELNLQSPLAYAMPFSQAASLLKTGTALAFQIQAKNHTGIQVLAQGFAGKKSQMQMGLDILYQENQLTFKVGEIHLKDLSWFKSLFKNKIKKKVRNRLEKQLIDLDRWIPIVTQEWKSQGLEIPKESMGLQQITFNEQGLLLEFISKKPFIIKD